LLVKLKKSIGGNADIRTRDIGHNGFTASGNHNVIGAIVTTLHFHGALIDKLCITLNSFDTTIIDIAVPIVVNAANITVTTINQLLPIGLTALRWDGAVAERIDPLFQRLGLDGIRGRIPKWR